MKLKFIGEHGSMGFEHGRVYECRLVSLRDGGGVLVFANGNLYCPYSSLRKMLENWEEVT